MNGNFSKLFLLGGLGFLTSCAPLQHNSLPAEFTPRTEREINAHVHWLYGIIPRHQTMIQPYDVGHKITWALFGNDDNGIFGETGTLFLEKEPISTSLALRWFLRNPFHNFTAYVIGTKKDPQSETIFLCWGNESHFFHYEKKASLKHHDDYFFLGAHGIKPFLSSTIPFSKAKKGRFYIGWRGSGSFGIKMILSSSL